VPYGLREIITITIKIVLQSRRSPQALDAKSRKIFKINVSKA
jgi:hypothetical protein